MTTNLFMSQYWITNYSTFSYLLTQASYGNKVQVHCKLTWKNEIGRILSRPLCNLMWPPKMPLPSKPLRIILDLGTWKFPIQSLGAGRKMSDFFFLRLVWTPFLSLFLYLFAFLHEKLRRLIRDAFRLQTFIPFQRILQVFQRMLPKSGVIKILLPLCKI